MNEHLLKISGSNIDTFQQCEYKFFYGVNLNLTPLELPAPMTDGTFGHSMMEEFFTCIMNGGTYEDAAQASGKLLLDVMDQPSKSKIYRNVLAFGAHFLQQPWRVVALEEKGSVQVSDTLAFAFTPDLVIEITEGPLRGQLVVMDYKFTGQYWNDREINMTQQIPKYIIYKNRRDGLNIRRGGVVMLNTRAPDKATGNALFLIKWLPITQQKLEMIERENEILMKRIEPIYLAGEDARDMIVHTTHAKTCKMCWFADDLCPAEMQGRDASRIIARNYKQNDHYGYNKDPKDPEETTMR